MLSTKFILGNYYRHSKYCLFDESHTQKKVNFRFRRKYFTCDSDIGDSYHKYIYRFERVTILKCVCIRTSTHKNVYLCSEYICLHGLYVCVYCKRERTNGMEWKWIRIAFSYGTLPASIMRHLPYTTFELKVNDDHDDYEEEDE